MAKKRRRPHTRPHPSAAARGAVRTVERPAEDPAETENDAAVRGRTAAASASTQEHPRPAGPQRSRAEKKELARRQREEVRRRIRRAEMTRRFLWAAGAATVIAAAVFLIVRPDEPTTRPDRLDGELRTEAPWAANSELALDRADAIGLPAEGTALHEHANVQVFVNGQQEPVPADIGVSSDGGASLHTHTGDGLVHIESAQVGHTFTLGEFFDVWGVRLSGTCLGAYCEEGRNELIVFRDGERVSGPVRDVVLDDETVVVLTFGTPDELPSPIPTFDFSTITA